MSTPETGPKLESLATALGYPDTCALCGREATGLGLVSDGDQRYRLCHDDEEDRDCYRRWTAYGDRP